MITSIINFKGGVAKTTTTINLAAALKKLGSKVLVIDTDPQGNVGTLLNGGEELLDAKSKTISYLYQNMSINPKTAIIKGEYFDYIPNNLYAYQRTQGMSDYRMLAQILSKIKADYDHIIIDTPPYLSFDAMNAIYASDIMMLVTDFSKTSLTGLGIIVSVLESWHDTSVASMFREKPKSILFTMYQKTTTIARQLLNKVENQSEMGVILGEMIPRSIKVVEDGYAGVPTVIKSPRTKVGIEYMSLANTWHYASKFKLLKGSKHNLNLNIK